MDEKVIMTVARCFKHFYRYIIGDWWKVKRCTWPYQHGYATYNPFKNTILDTGLSKIHAQQICDELNDI